MKDKIELLLEAGFEQLNNGKWIVKGLDPNQCPWFTLDEAINELGTKKIYDVICKINNTNKVESVEEAMIFLKERYQLTTTNEAKAIRLLIKYIESMN